MFKNQCPKPKCPREFTLLNIFILLSFKFKTIYQKMDDITNKISCKKSFVSLLNIFQCKIGC